MNTERIREPTERRRECVPVDTCNPKKEKPDRPVGFMG